MNQLVSILRAVEFSKNSGSGRWAQAVSIAGDRATANISELFTLVGVPTNTSYSSLRSVPSTDSGPRVTLGAFSVGDGGAGLWIYDPLSTLPDDGVISIKPSDLLGGDPGRRLRIYEERLALKWYSAVGDGVANDTSAINAWIAALVTTGEAGFAGAGTYLTDTITSLNLQVNIRGAGAGKTIFKSRQGRDVFEITGKSIHTLRLSDFTIDGASGTGMGLNVHDNNFVYNVVLRDIDVQDTGSNAIYLREAFSTHLENIFVNRFGWDGIVLQGGPATTLINCYVNTFVGEGRAGYRIYSGTTTLLGCNGMGASTNCNWATFGGSDAVISSGAAPPTVTLSGAGIDKYARQIRAEITLAGPRGVAEGRYTTNGGADWTVFVTAASVPLGLTGFSFDFDIGVYSVGDAYETDGVNSYALIELIGCNVESWSNVGIWFKGGSYGDYYGTTFFAGTSGVTRALLYDYCVGEAHTFDASSSISTLGATWLNGEPVHVTSGRAPFVSHNSSVDSYWSPASGAVLPIPTIAIASQSQAFEVSALSVVGEVSIENGTNFTKSSTLQTSSDVVQNVTLLAAAIGVKGTYDMTVWASGVDPATGATATLCKRSVFEVAADGSLTTRIANEALASQYDGITVGGLVVQHDGGTPGNMQAAITGKLATTIKWSVKATVLTQLSPIA